MSGRCYACPWIMCVRADRCLALDDPDDPRARVLAVGARAFAEALDEEVDGLLVRAVELAAGGVDRDEADGDLDAVRVVLVCVVFGGVRLDEGERGAGSGGHSAPAPALCRRKWNGVKRLRGGGAAGAAGSVVDAVAGAGGGADGVGVVAERSKRTSSMTAASAAVRVLPKPPGAVVSNTRRRAKSAGACAGASGWPGKQDVNVHGDLGCVRSRRCGGSAGASASARGVRRRDRRRRLTRAWRVVDSDGRVRFGKSVRT
ncbi:hypothetical protein B0H10DRAFT_2187369 [Mycena sp. CBHHK59/15]|nr:hypothetical protein B0H10DRAFT_2187369 [Mycena sp. CBHHK59/15]